MSVQPCKRNHIITVRRPTSFLLQSILTPNVIIVFISRRVQTSVLYCSMMTRKSSDLLHLLYHILFLLETVGIYLEVLVLQQIMSAIIAIFVTVSNQLWVLTSFINKVTLCLDGTDIFMASCSGKFYVSSWREHCSNLNFRKILNAKMKIN